MSTVRTVVAGTFGPLHDGHRRLLTVALEVAIDGLVVGLTTDAFATAERERPVPPFEGRRTVLESALADLDEFGREVEIVPLSDEYGVAVEDSELEAIVVSEETDEEVAAVNERRRERGMAPLVAVVVPLVTAEDGERISSTRVVAGEIDEHGTEQA